MTRALQLISATLAVRSSPPSLVRKVARGTGRLPVFPIVEAESNDETQATLALTAPTPDVLPTRAPVTYSVGPQRARDAYAPPPEPGRLLVVA